MRLVSNIWVGIISVCIAAASVVSSIVLELRRRAESRSAERAKTAAELVRLLEELGTAGLDQGLDQTTAQARHQGQLRQLHVVVRKNTAEYVLKAQKQGLSATAIALFFVEGLVILGFGWMLASTVQQVEDSQRWAAVLITILVVLAGAAFVTVAVVSNLNRIERNLRTENAGVKVSRWQDEWRALGSLFDVLSLRLKRRRQSNELKALAADHERPQRGPVHLGLSPQIPPVDGTD